MPEMRSPLPADFYLDAIDDLVKNIDPPHRSKHSWFRTDYARSLFITRSQDNEANSAPKLFKDLGILFFQGTVPPWARSCLLSGLLTPLNKKEVVAGEVTDARPVRAEDSDVKLWCQALGKVSTPEVRGLVTPRQLGIGVSSGVELYVHGFKLRHEEAVRNDIDDVTVKTDQENAHNSFPRDKALDVLVEAAKNNPGLIPLAVAAESILRIHSPIFMRSASSPLGINFLCNSEMG